MSFSLQVSISDTQLKVAVDKFPIRNRQALDALLSEMLRAAQRAREELVAETQNKTIHGSDRLAKAWRTETHGQWKVIVRNLYEDTIFLWWEQGTGLWGPHKDFIYPVSAKLFRFEKEGKVHYRPWIRGQPGKHVLESLNLREIQQELKSRIEMRLKEIYETT